MFLTARSTLPRSFSQFAGEFAFAWIKGAYVSSGTLTRRKESRLPFPFRIRRKHSRRKGTLRPKAEKPAYLTSRASVKVSGNKCGTEIAVPRYGAMCESSAYARTRLVHAFASGETVRPSNCTWSFVATRDPRREAAGLTLKPAFISFAEAYGTSGDVCLDCSPK